MPLHPREISPTDHNQIITRHFLIKGKPPAINPISPSTIPPRIFRVLLILWAVYAALFILSTSHIIEGQRWFALFDDGMISMRYARNLHAGHGLVWNPGERVEGITNPGWTFFMALCHGWLPLRHTPLIIQIACALLHGLLGILTFRFAKDLLKLSGLPALTAMGLTLFYYPLVNWTLQGMETGLLSVLICAAALLAGKASERDRFSPLPLLLMGIAMLVRLDAVVPFIVIAAWQWWSRPAGRLKTALTAIATAAVFFGGQTLCRKWYYGDYLPNTYYLKMTGFPAIWRITRGLVFGTDFLVRTFAPIGVFLTVAVFLFGRGKGKEIFAYLRDKVRFSALLESTRTPAALALALFAGVWAYSGYVGGDAWEQTSGANRFLSTIAPFYIMLAIAAADSVTRFLANDNKTNKSSYLKHITFTLAALVLFLSFNIFRQSGGLNSFLLIKKPLGTADNERNIKLALELDRRSPAHAVVAIDYAGTAPYFLNRRFIDLLGKSDLHTARTPMHRGIMPVPVWREFFPGHLKWDYAHTIGTLRPDIVCSIWGRSKDNADNFLQCCYRQDDLYGISVYWHKETFPPPHQ